MIEFRRGVNNTKSTSTIKIKDVIREWEYNDHTFMKRSLWLNGITGLGTKLCDNLTVFKIVQLN